MKNRCKKLVKFSYKKLKTILKILSKRNGGEPPAMESNDIIFKFDPEKTVQVAAMFLKLHGKSMKYLGLLKLIYMADRLSLERINQPLTGDNYVSMEYGPVLSRVYDFIKGNQISGINLWKTYIVNGQENHTVKLISDPGTGELSRREEKIIKEIYEECGNYDRFDLVNITHEFPEWQDPKKLNPPRKVTPINNIKILKVIGKTENEINEIKETVERELYLDEMFNNANTRSR